MTEISWIKLKTKMFDDEKIQLIEAMPEADAILVVWIKLLIQAGKTNANGYIMLNSDIPYTPEMLSTIFRRPISIIKFALKTLHDLQMIEVTDSNVICISNWEKHQNIEGLDKVREQNRLRQIKFREKKLLKQAKNEEDVTLQSRYVTQQNKNKNKNKEIIIQGRELEIEKYFLDLLPIDLEPEKILAWADWVEYRKDIKKKLVKSTAKKQIEFLLKQPDWVACINQSIKNQWQGLFEVKNTKTEPSQKSLTKEQFQNLVNKAETVQSRRSLYQKYEFDKESQIWRLK